MIQHTADHKRSLFGVLNAAENVDMLVDMVQMHREDPTIVRASAKLLYIVVSNSEVKREAVRRGEGLVHRLDGLVRLIERRLPSSSRARPSTGGTPVKRASSAPHTPGKRLISNAHTPSKRQAATDALCEGYRDLKAVLALVM